MGAAFDSAFDGGAFDGFPVPPVVMDHVAAALNRLPEQFKGKPNIEKLLRVLVGAIQQAEDAGQQLLTLRTIDTATGAQLDIIGKIVGQARAGLLDDDYRRYCRARVAANRSTGTMEDVLRVAKLVLNDPSAHLAFENQGIAAYVLRVEDVAISADLAGVILMSFLAQITAAGVRPILESGATDPDTWFEWDVDGRGWDNGFLIDARDPAHRSLV
jgi:hypothetical protein